MARTRRPIKYATPRTPKQKAIRITFHVLVWFGAAILYYVGFSLFFDTPVEYELKHSTDQLRDEYTRLEARYDSLRTVMENVSERDRNVFNILFESDPYDFDTEYETKRLATYESLLDKSDRQIILELKERIVPRTATSAGYGRRRPQPDSGHTARYQPAAHAAHRLLRHAHPPLLPHPAIPSGRRLHGARRFARLRHGRRRGARRGAA